MFRVILCVLVVVAASASAGYNFKDSDFNEVLFDEVAELDDGYEDALRLKRDTVPVASVAKDCPRERGRKDKDCHCCRAEKPDPKKIELLKDIKKKCITEIRGDNDDISYDPFNCEKMQVLKEQMVCTTACMAQKFGVLNEDGSVNRDAILTHLKAKYAETKWKVEALEGIVGRCMDELKESKEKEQQAAYSEDVKKGCNQAPLQMTHCIWREFVQACPAEFQIDSAKCKKIRERLAKGDTSYLNKSFLHHFYSHREEKEDKEH